MLNEWLNSSYKNSQLFHPPTDVEFEGDCKVVIKSLQNSNPHSAIYGNILAETQFRTITKTQD